MALWEKEKLPSMVPPNETGRLFTKADLDRAVREAVEADRAQRMIQTIADLPQQLRDVIYIEDCHISGDHDPGHTPRYVCTQQLAALARRLLAVLGVDLSNSAPNTPAPDEEWNKIPRRLDRSQYAWYSHYLAQRDYDPQKYGPKIEALETWERDGVVRK